VNYLEFMPNILYQRSIKLHHSLRVQYRGN